MSSLALRLSRAGNLSLRHVEGARWSSIPLTKQRNAHTNLRNFELERFNVQAGQKNDERSRRRPEESEEIAELAFDELQSLSSSGYKHPLPTRKGPLHWSDVLEEILLSPTQREKAQPSQIGNLLRLLHDQNRLQLQDPGAVEEGIKRIVRCIQQFTRLEMGKQEEKIRNRTENLGVALLELDVQREARSHPSVVAWETLALTQGVTEAVVASHARSFFRFDLDTIDNMLKGLSRVRYPTGRMYDVILNVFARHMPRCGPQSSQKLKRLINLDMDKFNVARTDFDKTHMPMNIKFRRDKYMQNLPTSALGMFNAYLQARFIPFRAELATDAATIEMQMKIASWRLGVRQKAEHMLHTGDFRDIAEPTMSSDHDIDKLVMTENEQSQNDARGESKEERLERLSRIPVWETVRKIVQATMTIYQRPQIELINKLMYGAMHYRVQLYPEKGRTHEPADVWPRLENVIATYDILRKNLLLTTEKPIELSRDERRTIELLMDKKWTSDLCLNRVIPSFATYELMIRGLARSGHIKEALHVFQDMTGSDIKSFTPQKERPPNTFAPTEQTFDAFFLGFAKFGVPSTLISFDKENPSKSTWSDKETPSDWKMSTLTDVLEAFLQHESRRSRLEGILEAGKEKDLAAYEESLIESGDDESLQELDSFREDSISDLSTIHVVLDRDNFGRDKYGRPSSRQLDEWIANEDVKEDAQPEEGGVQRAHPTSVPVRRCPNPHQLFNLLTALRRTSGDNADWVLIQFERVYRQFGPSDLRFDDFNSLRAPSTEPNEHGWTRWHYSNRTIRILEMLLEKRDRSR